MDLRPGYDAAFMNSLGEGHLPGYLGVLITDVRPGVLLAELPLREHLFAPNGYLHAGSVVTWGEVRNRVRRLATALQDAGIAHGDRVAFLAPNVHELLEAHFGVPRAGAVLVAVNTRLMPEEIAYILEHSGSRVLVVDESLQHLIVDAPVERVLVLGSDYESFLDAAGDREPEERLESEDDTISINYTSGTTGRPKGVMYTHRGAALNALAEVVHARLGPRSTYIWTLPMLHCNGWCFTWAATAAGATHVCLPKVDPPLGW